MTQLAARERLATAGRNDMLASPLDRAQPADRATIARQPATAEPQGPVLVAVFGQRAQAQRAISALRALGCLAEQVRVEGPTDWARESGWRPTGPGAVVGGALLGAALYRLAPPRGRGWLRGALGVPALGLSVLAALTALANPEGLEVLPWRVTVASADRLVNAGGVLRAHGARGVHRRPAEPGSGP